MSNIAGKAYAINLITPIRDALIPINKLIFWAAGLPALQRKLLNGLPALSTVHFARWLIVRDRDLPQLSAEQPHERLRHSYLLVFGSINCSLQQCVNHFASAFPNALSWLCFGRPGWPQLGLTTLQQKIARNQVWTDYFYSSYPLASANDIRSAEHVKRELCAFIERTEDAAPAEFMREYHALLKELQGNLGLLSAAPIVSMAARDQAVYVAAEPSDIPHDTDVYRAAVQPAEPRAVSQRVPARSIAERRRAQ
jgi:hypothetical protein